VARLQGDLKDRTFRFAEAILQVVDGLPSGTKGWVIGRQLVRAGTSVGANVREADQAFSNADFAYRCSIARKEASETQYWLELCNSTGVLAAEATAPLIREADELTRILASIVKRTDVTTKQI